MAHVKEGACQNGVEGVETLQAAEPPCSVSNGPMKINVKTSASGGLIYKTKHQIAKNNFRMFKNWHFLRLSVC